MYILDVNFRFNLKVCIGDLMQKVMSFKNVIIVSIEINGYRIHFWYISKDEAINLLRNADLIRKSGTLQNKFITTYKNGQRNHIVG